MYNISITDYSEDEIYTVAEFQTAVRYGYFIDYDGYGYPVKEGWVDTEMPISPSQIDKLPLDATHIVWISK